jgi:hypothetical protein
MALVTHPEWHNEVSERAANARPKRSRKIHPITWIVAAALIPILVWDVRQMLRESKHHNPSSEAFRSLHTGIRQ